MLLSQLFQLRFCFSSSVRPSSSQRSRGSLSNFSASTPPDTSTARIRLETGPAEDLGSSDGSFRLLELHLFGRHVCLFYAIASDEPERRRRTGDTVRYAQERVFNVGQLSHRSRSSFSSGVAGFHLSALPYHDQNVAARSHFRADVNDTGFIQFGTASPTFGISADLFRPQLGVWDTPDLP